MVNALIKVGVNALAIWVAVTFVEGLTYDDAEGFVKLAILAVILGVVNGLVKPLVKFFSFPAVLATLGLFLIVINIAMFGLLVLLSDTFSLGLDADGFVPIAIGGLIVSVVAWIAELVLPTD